MHRPKRIKLDFGPAFCSCIFLQGGNLHVFSSLLPGSSWINQNTAYETSFTSQASKKTSSLLLTLEILED